MVEGKLAKKKLIYRRLEGDRSYSIIVENGDVDIDEFKDLGGQQCSHGYRLG